MRATSSAIAAKSNAKEDTSGKSVLISELVQSQLIPLVLCDNGVHMLEQCFIGR